jgi:selenocysteine lyase/cysteine desulfurase
MRVEEACRSLGLRFGGTEMSIGPLLDVHGIRKHFAFPAAGRIVTNNAASTQPPRELIELYRSLMPWYENVHRGQSTALQRMTAMFERVSVGDR